MARPKKIASKPAKKTSTKSTFMISDVEAAFQDSLNQISTYWDKRIKDSKKKLEALKKKMQKAQEKQKATKDKRVACVTKYKAKANATTEKQLDKAKEAYQIAFDAANEIKHEVVATRQALQEAKVKLMKHKGLDRAIGKYEKEWDKKQVKGKSVRKATKISSDTNLEAEATDVDEVDAELVL